MSLRDHNVGAIARVLTDTEGFAHEIVVTPPNGSPVVVRGVSGDIGQTVDPSTGTSTIGRVVHCTLSLEELRAKGLELPAGEYRSTARPWLVEFAAPGGAAERYRVRVAMPDRTAGVVVLSVEPMR